MSDDADKELNIKWNGDIFALNMAADECVGDLKRRLGGAQQLPSSASKCTKHNRTMSYLQTLPWCTCMVKRAMCACAAGLAAVRSASAPRTNFRAQASAHHCFSAASGAEMTRVLPKRQKLMGLKDERGKAAADDCTIGSLKVKPGQVLMMVGAPEEIIAKANEDGSSEDGGVVDDFQLDAEMFEELEPHKDPDVLARSGLLLLSTHLGGYVAAAAHFARQHARQSVWCYYTGTNVSQLLDSMLAFSAVCLPSMQHRAA